LVPAVLVRAVLVRTVLVRAARLPGREAFFLTSFFFFRLRVANATSPYAVVVEGIANRIRQYVEHRLPAALRFTDIRM
jgi:hypothetical protein